MKKNKIRDEQKGIIFLIFIFLVVVFVSLYSWFVLKPKTLEYGDPVIRTLFLVSDSEKNCIFSNVLIYYPETQKAAVVNIPSNTGAIYQSLNRTDRIDSVFREKGIEVFKSEVEKILNCIIPFYINIELEDFKLLTDYLGGLRVFIPSPVDVTCDDGKRYLLPSGAVNLDGDKIESYLKYVFPEETFTEVQDRYQNVATAFFTALHDKKASVFKSEKVFKKYYDLMSINLSLSDSYRMMSLFSEMDTELIKRQTVTGKLREIDGKELLMPTRNGSDIREAVQQVTQLLVSNSGAMVSRIYVLEIQNGTTIQGLAHNTAILYKGASYDVLGTVNADRNDYDKTVIIDHIGNKEMAEMVGKYIHCSNIIEETVDLSESEDSASNVDFTIILGKDFDGRYVH